MKNIRKRSWITTTLGAIIILGSVASVLLKLSDWTQSCLGIAAGTGLLLTKDFNK